MSEELKPCSCGSTDTSIGYESPQGYWVECGDCGRQTEKSHGRDLAIAAWSRRAQPAEAEGVEVVAWANEALSAFISADCKAYGDSRGGAAGSAAGAHQTSLVRQTDHLAALAAERTRADVAVADANDAERALAAVTTERDQLRAEVEQLLGAMRQIRYASNNGPVSENNAGCIRRIEQIADAAMAAMKHNALLREVQPK